MNLRGALLGSGMTYLNPMHMLSLNPDEPAAGGGGDSGAGGDNQTGNSGDSNANGTGGDNAGQAPDPETFWGQPKSDDAGGDGKPKGDSQTDPGSDLGKQIAEGIRQTTLPEVFTREIGEQIAEGNLEGVNKQLQDYGRQAIQQSVVQSAKIMQHFGNQLLEQVRNEMKGMMGGEKDSQALEEAFPSMRDPAVRPVINGVFKQAMAHTKGDRQKALEMTRGMLKAMGKAGGQDFGIQTPPQSSDDYMGSGPSNLVEELLGRR